MKRNNHTTNARRQMQRWQPARASTRAPQTPPANVITPPSAFWQAVTDRAVIKSAVARELAVAS